MYGTYMLSTTARKVTGVDLKIHRGPTIIPSRSRQEIVNFVEGDFYTLNHRVDVGVAVEVFEHMPIPEKFINFLSHHCSYVFLTTPLAAKTGTTRNTDHIAEYTKTDFQHAVKKRFKILNVSYQHSDLRITADAKPTGCSMDKDHVVQMLWCRNKNGK
jgi:hypothetical protein